MSRNFLHFIIFFHNGYLENYSRDIDSGVIAQIVFLEGIPEASPACCGMLKHLRLKPTAGRTFRESRLRAFLGSPLGEKERSDLSADRQEDNSHCLSPATVGRVCELSEIRACSG